MFLVYACADSSQASVLLFAFLVFSRNVFGFRLSSEAKDKPNNLLMRSLTHVQEAMVGMLYRIVTDGRNVAVCLQWMLGLGCAYQLRVHCQLTCCPILHTSHKQIFNLSQQNRSFRCSDCIDATVMTVQTWPLEINTAFRKEEKRMAE